MPSVPISVGIPAHVRVDPLLRTLERVLQCDPAPDEIMVHVDGAVSPTLQAVADRFPSVILLSNPNTLGPGGARDVLIRAASHDWMATFDDDSYPEQNDYFARVMESISNRPDAAIFSSSELPLEARTGSLQEIAVFSGCGCIYHRPWYLRTHGYVPRAVAYGIEEVDLSLQLHAIGGSILKDPQLALIHENHHPAILPTPVAAEMIINTFLFPWVRYPLLLLPLGLFQALRYMVFAVLQGRGAALSRAMKVLPSTLNHYRSYRAPVSASSVLSWLRLRRSVARLSSPESDILPAA